MKDTKHDHHYRLSVDVYVTPPADAVVDGDMLEDAAQSCIRQRFEVDCATGDAPVVWAKVWSEIDTVELIQAGECHLCAPEGEPTCGTQIPGNGSRSFYYACTRPPCHAGPCVACGCDSHCIAVSVEQDK